ncbi:MAG: hypothetical protein R6X02_32225 [Enhygromyxa sp.]
MDLRTALEEVRVSDREAAGIEGELENWWEFLADCQNSPTPDLGPSPERVRLEDELQRLEVARMRVESVAGEGRTLPPFEPPDPPPLTPKGVIPLRYFQATYDALWLSHAYRRWFRRVFEAWSDPDLEIEPLAAIDEFIAADQRRRDDLFRPRKPMVPLGLVIAIFLLVAAVAIYQWWPGYH